MLVLLQLKPKNSFSGFVSTSYIGKVVKTLGEKASPSGFLLEKVCVLYEALAADKKGEMSLQIKYYTNSIVSNGTLQFKSEDILFWREVDADDEVLAGYHSAHEGLRMEKAGLHRANKNPKELQREA